MRPAVEFTKLTPCAEFVGEDAEDDALVRELIERARSYLAGFDWCSAIVECYLGDIAVGGVVAVLLFRIVPVRERVDEWLWVVVGDLPPAYLVLGDAPNPASALDAYIGEMERWIEAVKQGEPVDGLIPVDTHDGSERLAPTAELADAIEIRLRFLDSKILADYADDLKR